MASEGGGMLPTPEAPALSVGTAGLIAGSSLLLMAGISAASFPFLEGLLASGDATTTAANVASDETQFRLAVTGVLIVVALDVIVAWALYVFLRPVHRYLSTLAMLLRVVYAAILATALHNLLEIPRLLDRRASAGAVEGARIDDLVLASYEAFEVTWAVGLGVFGLHLLVVGYLAYEAEYVPGLVGVLVAIAGVGYTVDGVDTVALESYPVEVASVTFVGEVVLLLWLLYSGRTVALSDGPTGRAHDNSGPDGP